MRWEGLEFKASLGFTVELAWASQWSSVSTNPSQHQTKQQEKSYGFSLGRSCEHSHSEVLSVWHCGDQTVSQTQSLLRNAVLQWTARVEHVCRSRVTVVLWAFLSGSRVYFLTVWRGCLATPSSRWETSPCPAPIFWYLVKPGLKYAWQRGSLSNRSFKAGDKTQPSPLSHHADSFLSESAGMLLFQTMVIKARCEPLQTHNLAGPWVLLAFTRASSSSEDESI